MWPSGISVGVAVGMLVGDAGVFAGAWVTVATSVGVAGGVGVGGMDVAVCVGAGDGVFSGVGELDGVGATGALVTTWQPTTSPAAATFKNARRDNRDARECVLSTLSCFTMIYLPLVSTILQP